MARCKYLPAGETRTAAEIARESGVQYSTLMARLRRGIPFHEALIPPATRVSRFLPPGETRSLTAVAEEAGMSSSTLFARLDRGIPYEEAIARPVDRIIQKRKRSKYLPPGETRSLNEIADEIGICADTLYYRLRSRNMTLEEAISAGPPRRSKYLPEGETRTLSEMARESGIKRYMLARRLSLGVPLERAIIPSRLHSISSFLPEGETRSLHAILKDAGNPITYGSFYHRLKKGMSPEEALAAPSSVSARKIGEFSSLSALAREVGVSRERVRQLVKRGESVEDILSGAYKRQRRGRKSILRLPGAPDSDTRSLKELATHFGVPYSAVYSLYKKGWTYDQVMSHDYQRRQRMGRPYKNSVLKKALKGETRSLARIANEARVGIPALRTRLISGMSLDEAIKEAKKRKTKKRKTKAKKTKAKKGM